MSHCQQRCKRQLGRVIRFFYQFVTGTLSQGRCLPRRHRGSVPWEGVFVWLVFVGLFGERRKFCLGAEWC